jgi:hypothetical protein
MYDTDGRGAGHAIRRGRTGSWSTRERPWSTARNSMTVKRTDHRLAIMRGGVSAALKVTIDTHAARYRALRTSRRRPLGSSSNRRRHQDSTRRVAAAAPREGRHGDASTTPTARRCSARRRLRMTAAGASPANTLAADGEHCLTVKQTDIAGNTQHGVGAMAGERSHTQVRAPVGRRTRRASDTGTRAPTPSPRTNTPYGEGWRGRGWRRGEALLRASTGWARRVADPA